MTKNKLYILLPAACIAGYIWLAVAYLTGVASGNSGPDACLFKHFTGIPCPSCGSTRAMLALFKNDWLAALYWNPMGLILATIMIVSPLWILFDLALNKETLYKFYKRMEIFLRRKWVAIPLILLVMGNWIWNIYKGL